MRRAHLLLAVSLLGLGLSAPACAAPPAHAFAVIAAPDGDAPLVSRESLALIYRRKQAFWRDGRRVQPANLPAADPVRRAFSQCILGEPPEATEDYWREMYFHGVLPPHVVASEAAMILFVASTPGAIGYVSACPDDARVTVVMTFGDVPNCPKRSQTCVPLQE